MDKQLLNALDNLSEALVMISEALEKKGSSNTTTTNVLQSGDFSKQINEINVGIKSIKSDTQEILKNQKTILEISKSKEKKTGLFEETADKKSESNIKKGVSTILLIAVGVLAIGLAFKLVGSIDFVSVIGLSLAILVIAVAFEKVAKLKLTQDDAINTTKILVMIALGITVSSWILSLIRPIGITQALTAILIAGMFTVISFGISKILKGLGGENVVALGKSILFLPILLPAIALGITLSSWVLSAVTPITLAQAVTSILIAGMFTVISFGIAKILKSLGGANVVTLGKSILLLPILLPAIALGIALSSWVLQMVTPISFAQAVTSILIAAMFTVISFGMAKLLKSLDGISPGTIVAAVFILPLLLPAMALAIAVSSHALGMVMPITFAQFITALGISILFIAFAFALKFILPVVGNLDMGTVIKVPLIFTLLTLAIAASAYILFQAQEYLNGISFESMLKILVFSVCLAISIAVVAAAVWVVNKLGNPGTYFEGGVSLVIIATAIMVSSLILAEGKYEKYPDWKWSLGVGLSLLAFGAAAVVLGTIAMSGVGALAILAGATAILVVAATIVATSYILDKGKYEKYPTLDWSMGVGLSMVGFGMAMGGLGTFILGSLGLGMVALMAGSEAVLMIAQTIVDSSFILRKGNYTGGPTKAWSEGISLAIGAFSPVYAALSNAGFFSVKVTPEQMSSGIISITDGIITAANKFASVKVAFKNGPSKAWSEGVGLAIGAFSPVYKALSSGGFFSVKVTPEEMSSGIISIVDGIILAANKFSESKASFNSGPTKEWAQGVGSAMIAFSPIFKALNSAGFFTSGDDVVKSIFNGITWTAQAIVNVAHKFSKVKSNVWDSYPKKEWVSSVKSLISTFVGITKSIKDINWVEMGSIDRVASRIVNTAKILSSGTRFFNTKIDPNYIKSLSSNVLGFANLAKKLTEINKGSGVIKTLFGQDPVSQTANSMVKLASAYDKLASALKKFGGALSSIDGNKVNLIRKLTGNLAVLAAMNEQAFSNMMSTLENKASVFSKLLDADVSGTKRPMVGSKEDKKGVGLIKEKQKSKYGDTHQQLDIVIDLLANINHSTSSLDEYIASKGFQADPVADLTMK